MTKQLTAQAALAECICSVSRGRWRRRRADAVSHALKDAILRFGSETDDNRNCVDSLEFARLRPPSYQPGSTIRGLRLKGTALAISEVLNSLENLPAPSQLRHEFPEMSEKHWNAITRLATLLSLLLEERA